MINETPDINLIEYLKCQETGEDMIAAMALKKQF